MTTFISSVKSYLQRTVQPKYSDEFIEQEGYYPFYVPTDEWDSSYDVTIYFLKMYKNKNTEEVHFDKPSIQRNVEETVFDKEKVESLSDIEFTLHGNKASAIPAYIVKPETLPKYVRRQMKKSPIMEPDEPETITENLRNRIDGSYPE